MANFYLISFYKSGSTSADFVLAPGSCSSTVPSLSGMLCSLTFRKKIFAPCEIDLNIKLSQPKKYDDIINTFKSFVKVKLEFRADGKNSVTIAENYIIRNIKPLFSTVSTSTNVDLSLNITSPDIKLKDRTYCRTYVKDQLGAILDDAVVRFAGGTFQADHSKMQFLNYTKKGGGSGEFRQPYLVQYNESVYDLIARTANRCGEFLYFENGKLFLGLHFDKDQNKPRATQISSYDTLEIKEDNLSTNADTAGSYIYDNKFVYGSENKSNGSADYPINNDVAYDEYLGTFEKDKYDSSGAEDDVNCPVVADIFSTLLQCTVWYETIVDIAIMLGVRYAANSKWAKSDNESFNKKFFPTDSEKKDSNYTDKNASDKYDTDQYNGTTKLSQFKTSSAVVDTFDSKIPNKQMDNAFYDFVFSTEAAVSQNNIEISLKSSRIQDIRLGSIISVPAVTGSIYVVTEITGSEKQNQDDDTDNNTNWEEMMVVKAVKIFNDRPVPPPCVDFIRRSGAQRAYIKDLTDPDRAGRVRLSFPWDSSKNFSPWARVVMSSANHKGSGEAYFKPSVDDEVMVQYAGGNMERPFVTGFLHSSKLEYGGRVYNNVITTPGGQTLRQKDSSDASQILASIFPITGTLRQLIPNYDIKASEGASKLLGFTEITDAYGMYDVTMSSSKREVSIKSPFGKVKINAFTGISIDAPNGDISISGKNIKIEAGNNLTLISGANIERKSLVNASDWTAAGIAAAVVKKILIDEIVAKAIDFQLIRTLIETAITPIEGTLEIKSNRFLLVEAGKGNAQIPKDAYTEDTIEDKYSNNCHLDALILAVGKITLWAQTLLENFQKSYNEVVAAKEEFVRSIGEIEINQLPDDYKIANILNSAKTAKSQNKLKVYNAHEDLVAVVTSDMSLKAQALSEKAFSFYDLSFIPKYDGALNAMSTSSVDTFAVLHNVILDVMSDKTSFSIFRVSSYDFTKDTINIAQEIKKIEKKFIRTLIVRLVSGCALKCNLEMPSGFSESKDWSNDNDWNSLTTGEQSIAIKKDGDFLTILGQTLDKLNPFKRFSDIGVWKENQSDGAILFSDSKVQTLKFTNGTFNSNTNLGDLTDLLADLKTKMNGPTFKFQKVDLLNEQELKQPKNIKNEDENNLFGSFVLEEHNIISNKKIEQQEKNAGKKEKIPNIMRENSDDSFPFI